MTRNFTLFLLNKVSAQNYMSESEYENVVYSLEILLINIFKSIQIYSVALILGVLFETFIMNLAYALLRIHAGGWHAKSSINCSLFGLVVFVGIPLIFQKFEFALNFYWLLLLSGIILAFVALYAPADTEKNPLVSVSERKRKKILSLLSALVISAFSLFFAGPQIATLLVTGLLIETLLIHPLFYKLIKRRYKNYENYQNQP